MTTGLIPQNRATSPKWKQYSAGGPYDLVADGVGGFCCRKIVFAAAGQLTLCEGPDGIDSPITATMPAGYEHIGAVSRVTCTGTILVYW